MRSLEKKFLDEDKVARALVAAKGRRTEAARLLDVGTSTISYWIENSDLVQEVMSDAIEERIDRAERALDEMIDKRDPKAVFFTLRTLGARRGYIERQQIQQQLFVSHDDWVDKLHAEQEANKS